jgi:hypothetical protein
MLDQTTLALLAKLKVLAKKTGTNIDLVKMSGERAYAELILKELGNADDPELVLVVIQVMNQFGMIGTPEGQSNTEEKTVSERYVGSLR